jgi:hypothetical protein
VTARGHAARLLASSGRAAGGAAAAFVAYAITLMVARDRSFPEAALSPAGIALGLGLVLLLLAGAAGALLEPTPGTPRVARLLLRAGLALALGGVPASMVTRETHLLQVSEHQEPGPELAPGLGPLRFGRIAVAPRSDRWLLSKTVSIEAARPGEPAFEIGLWPAATLGTWRLTVLRYGFAPEIDWRDEEGRPIAQGFAMIGTFPSTEEEERLVRWTPEPRLMMGVGFYPPKLEDLLTPPGSPHHLFLRLDEAVLAGVRRDLRDPDAHRWLADGPAVDPVWSVEVFRGDRRLHAGRLRTGESARFDGGRLRVGETARWVEIQAVRDPLHGVAWAGAALVLAGALLRLTSRCRAARPRT